MPSQVPLPDVVEYCPGPQSVHVAAEDDVLARGPYLPAGQFDPKQDVWPAESWYVPDAQSLHTAWADTVDATGPYLPAAHIVPSHEAAAVLPWYCPGPHCLHVTEDVAAPSQYVPAAHAVPEHDVERCPDALMYCPGGQAEQVRAASSVSADIFSPGSQVACVVHEVARCPVWSW